MLYWIIGLVVIGVAFWAIFYRRKSDKPSVDYSGVTPGAPVPDPSVGKRPEHKADSAVSDIGQHKMMGELDKQEKEKKEKKLHEKKD